VAAGPAERLELDRPRSLGELLSLAFALFLRHFSLVFTLALIVVAPYVLVLDGGWGRALSDGASANVPAARATSALVGILIAQPLITAMLARIVVGLERGPAPSVGEGLRAGLSIFLPAAVAVTLAVLGVLVGFCLLIIPGIWVAVRWYFAAQAVVIEGRRAGEALSRSSEVVHGQWWSTAGRILVLGLVAAISGALIGGILGGIAEAAGSPALYVVALILAQAATSAFGAVAITLLFLDRRARSQPAVAVAG
jgi:hypothetical protein